MVATATELPAAGGAASGRSPTLPMAEPCSAGVLGSPLPGLSALTSQHPPQQSPVSQAQGKGRGSTMASGAPGLCVQVCACTCVFQGV